MSRFVLPVLLMTAAVLLALRPSLRWRDDPVVAPDSESSRFELSEDFVPEQGWRRSRWALGVQEARRDGDLELAFARFHEPPLGLSVVERELVGAVLQRELGLEESALLAARRVQRDGDRGTALLAAEMLAELETDSRLPRLAADLAGCLGAERGHRVQTTIAERLLATAPREARAIVLALDQRGELRPADLPLATWCAQASGEREERLRLLERRYWELPTSLGKKGAKGFDPDELRKQALRDGHHDELIARIGRLVDAGHRTTAAREAERLLKAKGLDEDQKDELRLLRGRALRLTGKHSSAMKLLRQVSSLDPERKARATYNAVLSARKKKRWRKDERAWLQELIAGEPSEWRDKALDRRAEQLHRDEPAEARRLWQLLSDEGVDDGSRAEGAWSRAWSLHRHGLHSAAAEAFEDVRDRFPETRVRAAASYWAARLARDAGREDEARERLTALRDDARWGFYALMASQELGLPPRLPELPSARETEDTWDRLIGVVEATAPEAGVRLRSACRLGFFEAALVELEGLASMTVVDDAGDGLAADELTEATWRLRVMLEGELAEHRRGLIAFRRAAPEWRYRSDIEPAVWAALYPLGYQETVVPHARANALDPALVFALIHQESVFDHDAVSHVGARGLMQIMPGTGRTIADWFDERIKTSQLLDPELNIRYGTAYLARLLERFDEPAVALSGYNAGGGRAERWWVGEKKTDLPLYVESIPFDETRGYVKAVLWNRELYRWSHGLGATDSERDEPVALERRP